jgi:hypothetical protein
LILSQTNPAPPHWVAFPQPHCWVFGTQIGAVGMPLQSLLLVQVQMPRPVSQVNGDGQSVVAWHEPQKPETQPGRFAGQSEGERQSTHCPVDRSHCCGAVQEEAVQGAPPEVVPLLPVEEPLVAPVPAPELVPPPPLEQAPVRTQRAKSHPRRPIMSFSLP